MSYDVNRMRQHLQPDSTKNLLDDPDVKLTHDTLEKTKRRIRNQRELDQLTPRPSPPQLQLNRLIKRLVAGIQLGETLDQLRVLLSEMESSGAQPIYPSDVPALVQDCCDQTDPRIRVAAYRCYTWLAITHGLASPLPVGRRRRPPLTIEQLRGKGKPPIPG